MYINPLHLPAERGDSENKRPKQEAGGDGGASEQAAGADADPVPSAEDVVKRMQEARKASQEAE